MTPARPPKVLFLGTEYAGHRSRFMNLRAHSANDARIRPEYRNVSGWVSNGWLERIRVLPVGVRGRMRATLEAAPLAALPRPDVIWTSALEQLAPYLWSQVGPLYRPLVMDWDAPPGYLEGNAQLFFGRPAHSGVRLAFDNLRRAAVWRGVSRFAAWSSWAGDGLERSGVLPERIRVLPPGVDLDAWRPVAHARGQKIRLLFVGADFERKGGQILVDVLRTRSDYFELDVVTRSEIAKASWLRVHRAEPNSPALRRLYADADLFVFPTRAECFGIAAVEAMASGLPVVIGDVGAAREIVDDGVTGFVVRPEPEDVAKALDSVARNPSQMERMGRRARAVAEVRFDGNRNDRRLVDLLLEEHERFKGRAATASRAEESAGLLKNRPAVTRRGHRPGTGSVRGRPAR